MDRVTNIVVQTVLLLRIAWECTRRACQTSPTIIHNSGGAACSIKRAGQLPINQRVGYFFAQKSEAVEKHKNNFPDSNKFQLNPVKLVWQQRRGYREAFLKPPEEMIETFSKDWLFQKSRRLRLTQPKLRNVTSWHLGLILVFMQMSPHECWWLSCGWEPHWHCVLWIQPPSDWLANKCTPWHCAGSWMCGKGLVGS